jgi:hypothetical protein
MSLFIFLCISTFENETITLYLNVQNRLSTKAGSLPRRMEKSPYLNSVTTYFFLLRQILLRLVKLSYIKLYVIHFRAYDQYSKAELTYAQYNCLFTK